MQTAFWKVLSILGVIGIGSLVVVEVQNRLPAQPGLAAPDDAAGTTAADPDQTTAEDVVLDAELTESQFEQRFASGQADSSDNATATGFDFSEPATTADTTSSETSSAEMAASAAFYGSQDQGQGAAVAVDNSVRREELADGRDPFEAFTRADDAADDSDSSAADFNATGPASTDPSASTNNVAAADFRLPVAETATAAVQPAGFQESGAFPEDTESADPDPPEGDTAEPDPFFSASDSAQPEAQPAQPATEPDPFDFGSAAESEQSVPIPPEQRTASQPRNDSPLLFFGQTPDDEPADDSDAAGSSEAGSVSSPAANPAAVQEDPFDPRGAAGSFDDETNSAAPDFDFPAFEADPQSQLEPRSEPQPQPNPQPATPTASPQPAPATSGDFFQDDQVNDDQNGASVPVQTPAASDGQSGFGGGDALPFVEDINSKSPEPADVSQPTADPVRSPSQNPDSNPLRPIPTNRDTDQSPAETDAPWFSDDLQDVPTGPADPADPADGGSAADFPDLKWPTDSGRPDRDPRQPDATDPVTQPQPAEIRQVSAVMRPHLVIRKNAPENATVGVAVPYSITVRNEGQSSAYDVVVEDELPAAATMESTQPSAEFDPQTRKLSWLFDEVAPGEERQIQVNIVPTGEGTLDGVATVQFKAQVKATTVIRAPKLELQLTGPAEVRIGDKVDYRYVIANHGTGEAREVFVRTVLPPGLKHPEGSDLEYEIQALRAGEQREITLTVVAADPGQYRAMAEVTAVGGASTQATSEISIIGKQLQLERRGARRRFVGRSATYENIVQNETTFDALDAEVIEEIPDGMKFISASDNGLYNPQHRTVSWRIDRLPAGKQRLLRIELTPLEAGEQKSVVTVVENAGFRTQAVDTTAVEDLHNVSADISRLDGPVAVGETFGFSISVDNRGTAEATELELSIQVPPELKIVGAGSPDQPAYPGNNNSVRFQTIMRIPPGQQQSFELRLQGQSPVQNAAVKALVRYKQMQEPLVVSESVTVYSYGD